MAPKVSITTLGCTKNIVETDFIKSSLIEKGYSIVSDPGQAEVIIVNTCGFIEPAKQEAIDTILEVSRYKECGRCQALIVVGCLAQRYPKELGRELPEIDAIVGLSAHSRLPEIIETTLKGEKIAVHDLPPEVYIEMRRRTASNGPSAYLQIADGCNNRCSYCAIPLIRGKYRSRAMESLLEETRFLLKHGVREINLIAQDITRYGIDLCGRSMLVSLVQELSRMDRLEWIRLLYMQPKNFSDELLAETAQNPKICPYLDLPFQHASERILKRMNRGGRKEDYLKLIERLRNRIPDLAIRTTVIVGFPGENKRDFRKLASFIKEASFDYVGVFEYSPEKETDAYKLGDRVPKRIAKERYHKLVALVDSIAMSKNRALVGEEVNVLIERRLPGTNYKFEGRTSRQAPEIDGQVLIEAGRAKVGEFVKATVTGTQEYDLLGEITSTPK